MPTLTLVETLSPPPILQGSNVATPPAYQHSCKACLEYVQLFCGNDHQDVPRFQGHVLAAMIEHHCPCRDLLVCWRSMNITPEQIEWLRGFVKDHVLIRLSQKCAETIASCLELTPPTAAEQTRFRQMERAKRRSLRHRIHLIVDQISGALFKITHPVRLTRKPERVIKRTIFKNCGYQ